MFRMDNLSSKRFETVTDAVADFVFQELKTLHQHRNYRNSAQNSLKLTVSGANFSQIATNGNKSIRNSCSHSTPGYHGTDTNHQTDQRTKWNPLVGVRGECYEMAVPAGIFIQADKKLL